MKYVIIDDNPKMRKIIGKTICTEGDTFLEYDDGYEAVEAYTEHQPDYVLMDIQMKVMNGITATKKILKTFPSARIIVITDYDTVTFRETALKAGAMAFFSKENLFEVKKYLQEEMNKQKI